ncbi:response regulator [Flavobacterium granuli]|uniref:DNA-binding NarL/FixJ family response regulator n=1 Tax=Flavobacterium granuli TaxID=280093 RepID=A0A1M5R3W4_9FLAO|nr:response regulator [Flavobacterium granuli]PRZ21590.1 DNA-binding NarL/FixJ family response regulator [Flavobacterium granuli]SHH20710.1 DNA-binding response regulator, NarL/FixJ family, contains REC and HTH domains [Flavobacterium granuli]
MNVFLVDDHPLTVEGYNSALLGEPFGRHHPIFTKAYNCEEAYFELERAISKKGSFDIAIIDKGLPAYKEKSILSGSDLTVLIRQKMSDCKIIMITAHTEVIVVYDIAKKIRPEGLIIKNDISPEKLQLAVMQVLQGNQYQSPMVKNCINEIWKKELMIEDYNRQILLYLSKGFKIKELEGIICLTTSAIQKRVGRMKKAFDATDDTGLVKEAIKQGFI